MSFLTIATGDEVIVLRESGGIWNGTRHLEGARVHRLAAHHHDGTTIIYAASLGEGVWCSRDRGARWSNGATRLPSSRVWSVASGEDGALYAGGETAMLQRSMDGGLSWETLGNLWLVPSSSNWKTSVISCLAPNPQHTDWLLCAIEDHGVLFSNDGGFSWDDVRPGAPKNVHSLVWHTTDPALVLALSPHELALSDDGGWSWRAMSWQDSQGHSPSDVVWQSASCDQDGYWWIIGHEKTGASVVWRAGAASARRVSDHPRRDAKLSAIVCGEKICVLGWDDGALFSSRDAGAHWQQIVIEGATPSNVRALILSVDETGKDETGEDETGEDETGEDENVVD